MGHFDQITAMDIATVYGGPVQELAKKYRNGELSLMDNDSIIKLKRTLVLSKLPPYEPGEVYYAHLMARMLMPSKYDNDSTDHRSIIRSEVERKYIDISCILQNDNSSYLSVYELANFCTDKETFISDMKKVGSLYNYRRSTVECISVFGMSQAITQIERMRQLHNRENCTIAISSDHDANDSNNHTKTITGLFASVNEGERQRLEWPFHAERMHRESVIIASAIMRSHVVGRYDTTTWTTEK